MVSVDRCPTSVGTHPLFFVNFFMLLKYYFVSFRNVGIYQEAVTARIYKDLKEVLKPEQLLVRTIYNTRGGMDVTAECGREPNI